MNEVQVFENPTFGSIRTIELGGQPYWIAADVTKILGFKRSNDAVRQHCHSTVKHRTITAKGEREVNLIPESDLYRLIVHSKLPSAKAFEKWVFEEILPQIRKTGTYGATQAQPTATEATTTELLNEIREIKKMLAGNAEAKKEFRNAPKLPEAQTEADNEFASPDDQTTQLVKKVVNAQLDLLEELFGVPRSVILHRCYEGLTQKGYDLEEIKEDHIARQGTSYVSTLDAILTHKTPRDILMYVLFDNIRNQLRR